jgi:hypothetical protein
MPCTRHGCHAALPMAGYRDRHAAHHARLSRYLSADMASCQRRPAAGTAEYAGAINHSPAGGSFGQSGQLRRRLRLQSVEAAGGGLVIIRASGTATGYPRSKVQLCICRTPRTAQRFRRTAPVRPACTQLRVRPPCTQPSGLPAAARFLGPPAARPPVRRPRAPGPPAGHAPGRPRRRRPPVRRPRVPGDARRVDVARSAGRACPARRPRSNHPVRRRCKQPSGPPRASQGRTSEQGR